MKYYFASLEPAWSKINYHNGIMWEASQHIQLQPSLGNKTNTQTGFPCPPWRRREVRGGTESSPRHWESIISIIEQSPSLLGRFLWMTFHVQYKCNISWRDETEASLSWSDRNQRHQVFEVAREDTDKIWLGEYCFLFQLSCEMWPLKYFSYFLS